MNIQAKDNTSMEEDGIGASDEETYNYGTRESDNDDEDGPDISIFDKE